MITSFSPHRQSGPTPVPESTPPFTPFKRSNSGLSSMEVPRHSPSQIPQTRSSTRRQGTLARTRSSPTRVALEASSTNNLNCTPPPALRLAEANPKMATPEPFKARQLRGGRGIENTPAVSSPLKRREATTPEAGELASPRVKRRSQDGIRSSSRSSSPARSSDGSSSGRSKSSRSSLLASVGKALSHTPKKPTSLKKVVNTHHFEKPKIARSRLQPTKPPVFNVSTPITSQVPNKIKRITSFDNFVSPAPRGPLFPQTAQAEIPGTPFAQKTSDTPFKKPFPAPFPKSSFTNIAQPSTFATPQITKPVQPHPAAFMSTGLLTKKNRPNGGGNSFLPPETPCKKPTFATRKPTMVRNAPPDTPFTSKARGRLNFNRTESFASIVDSGSPEGSQSNNQNDHLQTPTKRLHPSDSSGSLRGINKRWKDGASWSQESLPQTPQASANVNDLDASRLSISGKPAPPQFLGSPHPSTPRSTKGIFNNQAQTPSSSSPNKSFDTSGFEPTLTPVMDRTSKTFSKEWDPALENKFAKVTQVGSGEFSVVYDVEEKITSSQTSTQLATPENSSENGSPPNPPAMMPRHYAVKRVQFHGMRDRDMRIEEVSILKGLGKNKNVIEYIDSWESNLRVYIQTEFCELGGLDNFLSDYGNHGRLDPFRIWKIFTEISEGLHHVHEMGFLHLDLKPSNVLIGYDGSLKIADFGMATKWPASRSLEREGDREYLAPEVLQKHQYDRPADIYSLGLTLLEIAANVQLPDNGPSWQKLRSGDLSEIPDLTPESLMQSCIRDDRGFPVVISDDSIGDINESFGPDNSFNVSPSSHLEAMLVKFANNPNFRAHQTRDLVDPPKFMEGDSLKYMIKWLISPDPSHRPNTDEILQSVELRWIKTRRRSGAVVYEGEWGPYEGTTDFCEEMDISDLSGDIKMDEDAEDWIMME
ncbi:hypothetical protein ABW19_dt0203277 [Dactylella cylindrospora]|nr:hypothetical protein ABW19_dt0203277 [Dactylella cylindrospora]